MPADQARADPRACGPYELGATLDLLNLVFFPDQPGIGDFLPHAVLEANREQMRILKVGHRVVAHAGGYITEARCSRGLLRLGCVWGVACHPEHRRRGYAEACMRGLMAHLQRRGCHVGWLSTGIADWYRKLDWEDAGQGYRFTVDTGNVGLLPQPEGWEVVAESTPDLPTLLALHEQEALGAVRSLEITRVLLQVSRRGREVECYTARRAGKAVAYALCLGNQVDEWGGDPQVLPGLLRAVWELRRDQGPSSSTGGRRQLQVHCPVVDRGLPRLLRELRLPCEYGPRGMMWIADLPGLLETLGLADQVQAQQREGRFILTRGEQSVTLSPGRLAKLLLGPEQVADFAPDLFPLEFYHWSLDWV